MKITKTTHPPTVSFRSYASSALSYIGAMLCSNHALLFVSYPVQVVTKACKPIPVLLMGTFLLRRKYGLLKYAAVLLITIGIIAFMYKPNPSSQDSTAFGLLLLFASLLCDGFTGPLQERLMRGDQVPSLCLMQSCNLWAAFYMLIVLVFQTTASLALQFCIQHPEVIIDIALFSFSSAMGQIFIYEVVATFGALVLSIVTTTRKFFTLMLSLLWYGHTLTSQQWIGVALVFCGLTVDMLLPYISQLRRMEVRRHKNRGI